MELHQIQLTYSVDEDRILYRASFRAQDGGLQEVRAWLTRRLVKTLWMGIMDALEAQVTLDKPQAAHASADIVSMEHHAWVEEIKDKGNFNNRYETGNTYPLGEAPILIRAADFSQHPGRPIRINMVPAQGDGFEIAFTLPILHGFCSLLKEAVSKAGWDMALVMPGEVAASGATHLVN
ncbi:MAG: hypothetical protein ACREX0_15015 [Noviherbaspirillum sp.]